MNHASRRSLSRYGMEMSFAEQCEIAGMISRGEGKRLRKCYPSSIKGAELWAVHWARLGRAVPVIYLTAVEAIATFLPASVLDRKNRYRELDVDWIEEDREDGDAFDADALADVLVSTLRAHVRNNVLEVRMKEAGVTL